MTLLFLFLTCSAACAVGVFTMALIASGKIADLRAWNAALSEEIGPLRARLARQNAEISEIQDAAFRQGMRVAAAFVESKSGRGHSLANVAEWVRKKAAKPSLKRPAA